MAKAFAATITNNTQTPTSYAAHEVFRANSATYLPKSSLVRACGAQLAALQSIALNPAPAMQAFLIAGPHEP